MGMAKGFNLEPPHLSVEVYVDSPEEDTFSSLCEVVEQSGCRPNGLIEVVPWSEEFELRSDLATTSRSIEASDERFSGLIRRVEDLGRPVRARYMHKRFGRIVVEYMAGHAGERHPIAISTSAEALGMPDSLWGREEKTSARKLAEWTIALLKAATVSSDALYGGIGVEFTLPTPMKLSSGASFIPSEVFVSRNLLERHKSLLDALIEDFEGSEEAHWDHGVFFSGWAPYNRRTWTLDGIPHRFSKSSSMLGKLIGYGRAGRAGSV